MALDTTLLTRNRVVGSKAEVTTGTAIALAAADCALFNAILDPKITPAIPPMERQQQQYLSKLVQVPGARRAKFAWKSEIFGSGVAATAPTWATVLFPPCALSFTSNVAAPFTPTPALSITTNTLGIFQAGRLKQIAGACGNFKITGKAGQPLYVDWDFEGVWQPPTATAIPASIAYPTTIPPRFAGATITLGGTTYRAGEFEFDAGVKVYVREDVSNVAGYRAAVVVDRMPVIKIPVESLPLGTQDWFAGHLAGTTYAFNLQTGTVAGNQFQLQATNCVLNNPPQDKDLGGLMGDDLEFLVTGSADSDYSITFA